jgi:glucose/arabinose dehydrogenase
MRQFILGCFIVILLVVACTSNSEPGAREEVAFDWRSDWAVQEGFTIEIDTEGYSLPTSIAFVPHPGTGPKDPLYFVTELRGQVKVVTNDRTIYTFAEEFFPLTVAKELPSAEGQAGLAGICLDPLNGYVFVTFAYQDENNILRNNIVRFQSEPEKFSLEPVSKVEFTEIFQPYETGLAHQIGSCQVSNGLLYVSVGEGWQAAKTQQLNTQHGKILRMTLDGKPVPENPFYEDNDIEKATNYIWAYGLRNPFGLTVLDERVFVADNGKNIDRFLEIHEGENYLWDGNDNSIASNADYVFVPSRGPVQLDHYPQDSTMFPAEYRNGFFVALSAFDSPRKIPGVVVINFDLEHHRVVSTPGDFVKYRGSEVQGVTGLAFGPDALYYAPLYPNREGKSYIFKITYDPGQQYPFNMVQIENGQELFAAKGCVGCHTLNGAYGYGGSVGPPLDREALVERLQARLNSVEYLESLEEIDQLAIEPQASFRKAREEVLTAEGLERVWIWTQYRIQEPKFDNNHSQMPNTGVSAAEAAILTDFLLGEERQVSGLRDLLPRPLRTIHLALAFVSGLLVALFVLSLGWALKAYTSRRR